MKTLWLPNHTPTTDQLRDLGVVTKLSGLNPGLFEALANCPSSAYELEELAEQLCEVCLQWEYTEEDTMPEDCMIVGPIGSPAFMFIFAQKCAEMDLVVTFSHSERVSTETVQEDGTVRKSSVFQHMGWITF